ncbi:hypothetical protein P168DRAFT_325370 [Aspergillus campestris IBT 28561]|uniref:Uncharacterized protein n=1 Tax=Aspergillus campestris (strain IBT 28561) TaxID=1392248 RepID=A0A2I1D9F6_ASPC2|nr:uncharacterized protein P168DRAFT_325370 [Aspergillus campestris IBT 28561]PKY06509.1 hypothetical protein P168DRAFT_325370 [Aspergillus campestris IBT 28561]
MSDLSRLPRGSSSSSPAPPPPPPPAPLHQGHRYSNRAANALARFAQPFFSGSRPPSPQTLPGSRADLAVAPRFTTRSKSLPGASQTVTHKTGIPIAAVDISPQRTHAVIGGKEILKTIRVSPDHLSEEFNLRNTIISYASTHHGGSALSARHKDQLTVRDVKWSHGHYDQIIATAVANGRIVLYDLHRPGLEFCRFQGHSRQVHRLAFNPHHPQWLLSGSQDSSTRLWDLRMPSTERGVPVCGSKEHYMGNSDAIRDIRWSPSEGFAFATATDSGAIQLWDSRKNSAPLLRITAHDRPCFSVDWHPDGKHIISGGADRQVKVWDFSSSAERRQKPTFQFRTPQAVLNVRWRPPSWDREPEGNGDWQSSQVVTSYDKEDPRIHLWDLRRPYIPFREFDRYESHAADLLWHSKDLLWTAGESGSFTQTDVRYAPHIINQRPTCSVAWSPSGEVLAFVQKRPARRALGLSATEFVGQAEEENSSGEVFSQSPADDSPDEPSFTVVNHRHSKSTGARPSKSLDNTPPGVAEFFPILSLEKTLAKVKPPGPRQLGAIGGILGATMDRGTFRYLARNYASLFTDTGNARTDPARSLLESLDHNAGCAEDVSLVKLAQTWQVIRMAVAEELRMRAQEQRQNPEKATRAAKKRLSKEEPGAEKTRTTEDGKLEKMKSRFFKGTREIGASKLSLADTESASNMTTPLAQPLPDSPIGTSESSASHMTSLNDPTDIQPLPPSLLSSRFGTMESNESSSMSELGTGAQEHGFVAPDRLSPGSARMAMSQAFEDEQRSAPRAITGRADWRALDTYPARADDNEDEAAVHDYKSFPKKALSLESHGDAPKAAEFRRHGSSDSFPMFSASTGSSHPSRNLATSFSSANRLHDVAEDEASDEEVDRQAPSEVSFRAREASLLGRDAVQGKDAPTNGESPVDSHSDAEHVHLERPSSPLPLLKESSPLQTPSREESPSLAAQTIPDSLLGVTIPIKPDGSGNKPWSAEALLKQAIRYCHSSTRVDTQSAAHFLQKLRELFQDCEEIIPSHESELLFKAYNEDLQRQSMYIEAAELRLLCVPSYPAVYEYAQTDTYMNVYCFTCKRPYENPRPDNRRCHRCQTPQEPCAICMSLDPPPEWVLEQSEPSTFPPHGVSTDPSSSSNISLKTEPIPASEMNHLAGFDSVRPKGSTLWTWCQGCGHGGHMACIHTWLKDTTISEGGCATPGCAHDCGPGPRRDHNRRILQEESKRRDSVGRKSGTGFVKRDPWAKGESKAVEKVRGMLGAQTTASGASSSANSAAPSTTSNLMSPKKVRLVTPSEQGRRRGTPSRSSIGGSSTVSG